MTLVRSIFLALAVMLPVTWTVAKAADPAPAEGGEKKEKKAKKAKKAEGEKKEEEKK
jgi:ribosomal protein L12E/L44/L45/RPP1/RPP2